MHFLYSPGFEMKKAPGSSGGPPSASVNEVVINNGTISLIRVTPGSVGPASGSKQPVLLGAGLHFVKRKQLGSTSTDEAEDSRAAR